MIGTTGVSSPTEQLGLSDFFMTGSTGAFAGSVQPKMLKGQECCMTPCDVQEPGLTGSHHRSSGRSLQSAHDDFLTCTSGLMITVEL